MRGAATQAAIAAGVNHTVRLPRARRPASYSAQLVTRCRCFGMLRRQAALALNGTAGVQASEKGPSSYTAQLPTPTGRSVQQGAARAFRGFRFPAEVILWAVRWYLQFPISYRDLEAMLADRGVAVDHTTMYRWVHRFAPELEKRMRR